MRYVKLGGTGLDVSRLALGCMSFGKPTSGAHVWTLDEDESRPIIRHAVEAGINFFDTANSYSAGTSEEILGKLLKEFTRRDETVIATKVYFPLNPNDPDVRPNKRGLSRKAILAEIDNSLARLGVDHVDLYQIHRWDYLTPIEETMEALHDVVRTGKARHIGASSMFGWQFAKAQNVARTNGWTPFVTMQNQISLLYREEEREMIPLCHDLGVGLLPWSPLARGRLARPPGATSARDKTDQMSKTLFSRTDDMDRKVIEAVAAVAGRLGLPMAQVALAWVLAKPDVSAPLIGATKVTQLDDAIAAVNVKLSNEDIEELEAPYVAHEVAGFE